MESHTVSHDDYHPLCANSRPAFQVVQNYQSLETVIGIALVYQRDQKSILQGHSLMLELVAVSQDWDIVGQSDQIQSMMTMIDIPEDMIARKGHCTTAVRTEYMVANMIGELLTIEHCHRRESDHLFALCLQKDCEKVASLLQVHDLLQFQSRQEQTHSLLLEKTLHPSHQQLQSTRHEQH